MIDTGRKENEKIRRIPDFVGNSTVVATHCVVGGLLFGALFYFLPFLLVCFLVLAVPFFIYCFLKGLKGL